MCEILLLCTKPSPDPRKKSDAINRPAGNLSTHGAGLPAKSEDKCNKNLNQGNANLHSEFPCLSIKAENWVEA